MSNQQFPEGWGSMIVSINSNMHSACYNKRKCFIRFIEHPNVFSNILSKKVGLQMPQSGNWSQYASSPELQKKLYRRTLWIVVLAQLFGGAGVAAGVTVGALLIREMMGTESFAGMSAALYTAGSAAAAYTVGRLTQRFGRRWGLTAGFLTGGIGAIGVIFATVIHNLWLLFIFFVLFGSGMASNLQARYAGTDLAKPSQRATAISFAMVSSSFGAIAGPNLVEVMGEVAESLGIPKLAGPFILGAAAYILSGLIFLFFLRPDPYIVARAISAAEAAETKSHPGSASHSGAETIRRNKVAAGAFAIIMAQFIMVAIMTMTPIHMQNHGHGLGEVGFVIGLHIASMYLPSLFTGVLTDKLGRTAMAYASGAVLLASGILAAAAPADNVLLLAIALSLLGLGWNLGFISGTSMIVDATTPAVRAKTQGTVDVLVNLAGASGGMISGIVTSYASYTALSLAGGSLSLLLIPVLLWSRARRRPEGQNRQMSL
jgi:MFS family permease